jgi:hypothetical protein
MSTKEANKAKVARMKTKGGAKTPALDPYHAARNFIIELDEGTPAQYIMENAVSKKNDAIDEIDKSGGDVNRDGSVKRK